MTIKYKNWTVRQNKLTEGYTFFNEDNGEYQVVMELVKGKKIVDSITVSFTKEELSSKPKKIIKERFEPIIDERVKIFNDMNKWKKKNPKLDTTLDAAVKEDLDS